MTANECLQVLELHDYVLILTHRSPDGDAIGSAAALCVLLRTLGKTAYLSEAADAPENLARFARPFYAPDGFTAQFIVTVDIADVKLIPENAVQHAQNVGLCIDHHASNRMTAQALYVDCSAAACAELIYRLVIESGTQLTREIAEYIFLGLVTDTGCFKYPSVTPFTLRCAAECVETGLDFYALNREFIETISRSRLAVECNVLENCDYLSDGAFAFAALDHETLGKLNASDDDTANISSFLRCVEGVKLSVFAREKDSGIWRISARSDPSIDASAICETFSGGGHKCAAGATIKGTLDEMKTAVFDAVRRNTNLQL